MKKAKPKKKAAKKAVKKVKKKIVIKKAVKKIKKTIKKKVEKVLKKKIKPEVKKVKKPLLKKVSTAKLKSPFAKKELKDFREKLLNVREDILERIRELSEDTLMKSRAEISGDISGYSIHPADMASDNYEREFSLGLVSNERRLLLEIDDALKRVKDGTYGVCLYSGKPISKTRLNVIPYTKYRKDVQEQLEKEGRL